MNETKQPSLDDTKSATKNIVVLHKNTPPPKNNHIVMLHRPSCETNASAPNNKSESNASTSNNTCNPNASDLKNKDYYTHISFRHLRELEKLANIAKKLTSKLDQKKYVGSPLGRRLLGQAILQCPKVGGEALATIISLSVAAFLADCDVTSLLPNVPLVCPSRNTLKLILVEEAADTILLERNKIQDKPFGIMCDKGNGAGHRNGACFVKLMPRYKRKRTRVRAICIGIESAGNDSVDAAKGIDHSLLKFDSPQKRVKVSTQGTDAGGGGVGQSLGTNLTDVDRVKNPEEYDIATCTLHAMSLTLQSPVILVLGDGGITKRTALQVLHTAYNLSQKFRVGEWKKIWKELNGEIPDEMKEPVMSRWECVSEGANNVAEKRVEWLNMANQIVQAEKYGTNKHTIASWLTSYLNEPMLMSHINFLNAYSKVWWMKHFSWHKHVDQRTKLPGFLSIYTPLHYFVQTKDLRDMMENWKTMDEFHNFVSTFPAGSSYTIDEFVRTFLKRVEHIFIKHFEQWRNKFYLTLADDDVPAMFLAKWLTSDTLETIDENINYTSEKTQCNNKHQRDNCISHQKYDPKYVSPT